MIPHLLRCQGLAVKYYGFALGRLGSGAPSAFATTGFTFYVFQKGFKRVFQAPVSLTPPALNRLPPAVLEDFSFLFLLILLIWIVPIL